MSMFSEKERKAIAERWIAGASYSSIARDYGCSTGTIINTAKADGWYKQKNIFLKDRFTEKQLKHMKIRYESGKVKLTELARKHDLTEENMWSIAYKLGWRLPQNIKRNWTDKELKRLTRLWFSSKPKSFLMRKFNCTYHQLKYAAKRRIGFKSATRPWAEGERLPLTGRIKKEIKTLYLAGGFIKDIAGLIGCGENAVKGYVSKQPWKRSAKETAILSNGGTKSNQYKARLKLIEKHGLTHEQIFGYKRYVRTLTEYMYQAHIDTIDPERKRGNDFHLDHIYSIAKGLKYKVSPLLIAHPANLKIISAKDNCTKRQHGIWTRKILKRKIREFGAVEYPDHLLDVDAKTFAGIENYKNENKLAHKWRANLGKE